MFWIGLGIGILIGSPIGFLTFALYVIAKQSDRKINKIEIAKKKKATTDALEILHRRFIKGDKKRLASINREREKLDIEIENYFLQEIKCANCGSKKDVIGFPMTYLCKKCIK